MSAEQTLYSTLTGDATVQSLLGTRVYPDFLAEAVQLPAVVYQRVGTDHLLTLLAAGAQRAIFELWCLAESRTASEDLANAVINALIVAGIPPTGRRYEYDPDVNIFSSVVECNVFD